MGKGATTTPVGWLGRVRRWLVPARGPKTRMGRTSWVLFQLTVVAVGIVTLPAVAAAAKGARGGNSLAGAEGAASQPISVMVGLSALSLLPFMIIMLTSFVKIAVVLSIVRQALGTNQVPPTQILTGMSIVFTVYVMHPVGLRILHIMDTEADLRAASGKNTRDSDLFIDVGKKALGPIREFLTHHTHVQDQRLFYTLAQRMNAEESKDTIAKDSLTVLIPSFVLSELTEAFQIGFIIFLPFVVIDMVCANILLALGMQMLSPTTVSLPFKLLLFILVDGWVLLTRGLVLGYS